LDEYVILPSPSKLIVWAAVIFSESITVLRSNRDHPAICVRLKNIGKNSVWTCRNPSAPVPHIITAILSVNQGAKGLVDVLSETALGQHRTESGGSWPECLSNNTKSHIPRNRLYTRTTLNQPMAIIRACCFKFYARTGVIHRFRQNDLIVSARTLGPAITSPNYEGASQVVSDQVSHQT